MALDVVASGTADAVAFGKAFISNPDLAQRLRDDAPLAPLVRETLYDGGEAGYTDYPVVADDGGLRAGSGLKCDTAHPGRCRSNASALLAHHCV